MMFGKDPAKMGSFIGPQSEFQGDITVRGTLRVDGRVTGKVQAEEMILSKTAVIKGDVLAQRIIVGGSVEGTIRATALVEIRANGRVQGDIFTDHFSVMDGARFNGRIDMSTEESRASKSETSSAGVDQPQAPLRLARGGE
jgi:cytoskeletal protein CcmA (bactofilin family)